MAEKIDWTQCPACGQRHDLINTLRAEITKLGSALYAAQHDPKAWASQHKTQVQIIDKAAEECLDILKRTPGRFEVSGAINWGDLHVSEVLCVIGEDFNIRWEIIIEEADPGATMLHHYMREKMHDLGFDVEVRTEW